MVKKGLSLEQKRERVLEFFHETDSVFQFKEVEKEAVKRGVTAQSVKDVVQSLVDDNLVYQVLNLQPIMVQTCWPSCCLCAYSGPGHVCTMIPHVGTEHRICVYPAGEDRDFQLSLGIRWTSVYQA